MEFHQVLSILNGNARESFVSEAADPARRRRFSGWSPSNYYLDTYRGLEFLTLLSQLSLSDLRPKL